MEKDQHYSFQIYLTKDFLKKTHSHPLIAEIKGIDSALYDRMWKNTAEDVSFYFGGKYGIQFTSVDQIQDFNKAFNRLLERKSISKTHKPSLLYFILFLERDFEKQSIERNTQNRLKDYSNFISDLYINGENHIQQMTKKKEYVKKQDPYTLEYFFAKKHLVESMELNDLIEYFPEEKNREDVIRYLRISIGHHEIYVPKEMIPKMVSSSTLKSMDGEMIPSLDFPPQFKYQLLRYTVETMMKEHEKAQTALFKLFQAANLDVRELKGLYKTYKKHKLSNVKALAMIGVVVTDYLKVNKLLKSKTEIADFLWEYFALFKAYDVQKTTSPQLGYSELPSFYNKNKITAEYVRALMKENEPVIRDKIRQQVGDF